MSDPELEELQTPTFEYYADDDDGEMPHVPDADDEVDVDTYDQYKGAEVTLPVGDQMLNARVCSRKRTYDGKLGGRANPNPILDTRMYNIEYSDGQTAEIAANVIAQNIYAMCDTEGIQYLLLDGIVGHQKDMSAMERTDMYVQRDLNRHMRKTTQGWKLCVEWKDGTTSWERLADLKESNPVEVAEYATTHSIDVEPAFAWWVPYTLRRRNIIVAVNARYHMQTHKFGIEVPKTFEDCLRIDRENGNTHWQDAICKEMAQVQVAFEVLEDGKLPPPTFQEIRCHLVFDIEMES